MGTEWACSQGAHTGQAGLNRQRYVTSFTAALRATKRIALSWRNVQCCPQRHSIARKEVTAPLAALLLLLTPYIWHVVLELQFEQLLVQSRQEGLELLQAELARLIRPKEGDQEAAGGAMQAADAAAGRRVCWWRALQRCG